MQEAFVHLWFFPFRQVGNICYLFCPQ